MQTAPENWPAKTLNGYKLDLFGIYRQVVARGGWGEDEITCKRKINWSREIFPKLANFTSTHKATSVGHDLITSYKNYLHSYERKYADVDCNADESKERELVNSIQRNTPRAGVTGTRSPGQTSKRKPVGRPRASNLASGGGGSGNGSGSGGGGNAVAAATAPVAPSRGGGRNRGGARSKPKRTFPDGAKIKVFWPKENDWFFGTIVQQEYMPADGQTYSKIEYEDGDEEVLNLANEKVKLLDEKSDDDDDDDDDDGLVYVPRPTARRRGAAEPSRAPFAADTAALINAATGDFGDESDKEEENKDEGRRRTRLNGADPNAPEPPPPKERVEIVEEMMEHHNAARVLAELPNECCTEDETYRLGYRMGLRRMAKVSTAMLIEKMQKMLVATGGREDEAAKAVSGESVLDEFFDDGKTLVSKEKAQALFNALIDAAYTPDKDAASYDAKGEPAMPKRAPEPEDPENMPGTVKEEEENADENAEEKKKEDDGSGGGGGGGGSSGNGGDDNDNNKGPGPSSDGGGNAGGDQKPDDTNKDNEHNGGNNGENEDDDAGATGFHASMLADKMDIDIPSPTKEKKEELKKEEKPVVAPTRNSGRQRTVSKKVLEAVQEGLMKSPVKLPPQAGAVEPASKRAKTENLASMRTMQTSVAHGGMEKRNPNKNETSTASPSRPVKATETQATATTNEKEEEKNAKKKPAPAAPVQVEAPVTEDGDEFVPLPPVPGPPEWTGPVPKVSNSDPEYLLHQLKVFIAKSGAVLDRAWRVTVAIRTQGASAGSYDATYWAPDNKRYRSRLEVARAVGVAPWVAPKKPKGQPRKPRDPNAPKRSAAGPGRSRGGAGYNFRRPLDSYPVVELKTPPPPPTQRVLCELLGDGTAVRWLEKHGLGEHAAAFVMHGIMRKNQLFAPLLMQDMENFGLDLETGAKALKFIEETRQNASSSALTVEQLTPVPFGRRVTSEVFCDGREEYYDPGTFLFDESELCGRGQIGAANPLFGLIRA